MKKQIEKIFNKLIFLIIGIIIGFFCMLIIYVYDYSEKDKKMKYIVEKSWLEKKLFSNYNKKDYDNNKFKSLEELFGIINSCYYSNNKELMGFEFDKESIYQGYAKLRINKDLLEGIEVYSLYDVSIYDYFKPTYFYNLFILNNNYYIYNSKEESLYKLQNNNVVKIFNGINKKIF